jgi:hypothetical protein
MKIEYDVLSMKNVQFTFEKSLAISNVFHLNIEGKT